MKQKLSQSIKIPEGVQCTYENTILKCRKDSLELEKKIKIPSTQLKIENSTITLECKAGNKVHYKKIKTAEAHIKNIFRGLQEPFEYHLEAANIHFPISLKVEGSTLQILNFLGEKVARKAAILPNVKVEIKGQQITLKSADKEAAGQTAGNFEKATRLKGRDRRIFQDGIYITSKPGDK